MRPDRLLLRLLGIWLALAALPCIARIAAPALLDAALIVWGAAAAAIAIAASIDALRRAHLSALIVQRQWPERLAVGVGTTVALAIANRHTTAVKFTLREDAPVSLLISALPSQVTLQPGEHVVLRYRAQPERRGDIELGPLWLRIESRWRLWQFRRRAGAPLQLKVYPNFAAISHLAAIDVDAQIGAMGIHLQQRRGEGSDFRQLRAFREGDALRQIDWKATSRYQKPISREYQEERDQDVVFLLDCGRRMRTLDGELSHFDHALNAILLTGYVALRHGDAVGLMTYAGSERWLPPLKSQGNINRLLNHVYDLHSSTATSDFVAAAQQLVGRQRKRSLVILVSEVRDDDIDDLRLACALLGKRHLVIVASLRETVLDTQLLEPVRDFEDALKYSGTTLYRAQRGQRLQSLQRSGVATVDCLPGALHVELVRQYLAMKRGGLI